MSKAMDDKGLRAPTANEGDASDYTAALEFELLASNLTSNSPSPLQFDVSHAGIEDIFFQDLQGLGMTEGLHDEYLPDKREASPFAVAAAGPLHPGNNLPQAQDAHTFFDTSDIFLFSEALGGGEPKENLPTLTGRGVEEHAPSSELTTPAKIGTRFSHKSLRVLKTWLTHNSHHPYPTTADMESLERQTGLTRQQISNWLANTRRRNRFKAPPKRPPSPAITSAMSRPINIHSEGGLPQAFDEMNPLQRWQNSPPEHEPASASAIAHAVYDLSPGCDAPADRSLTDSAPARSLYNASSASSAGTSHSSRSSVNSAYSHHSRVSLGSLEPFGKAAMKRRRRRGAVQRPERKGPNTLSQAANTYQCTFCTETFKTKHNWQRHEKSLHLSLERWECAPEGPTILDAGGNLVCVFCGDPSPDEDHLETHNYSVCKERVREDRTFYRKDHLQQHLKLVHDAKFLRWPMGNWKSDSEMIRSRCGFCGLVMGSWIDRTDHLAEHFKDGKTMEHWHGDWGFDDNVLKMIENSMAPYMIHMERYSPWPFTTKQGVPKSPPNAFELIKLELDHFVSERKNTTEQMPTNAELLYESCCIILGCEIISLPKRPVTTAYSWLHDLLMSCDSVARQARVSSLKAARKSRITYLSINGKANIFEACALEEQLLNYVELCNMMDPSVSDADLQKEACRIVERVNASSPHPSQNVSSFLLGLINASTQWLTPFRERANLALSERLDVKSLDAHNQSFLGASIVDFNADTSAGNESPVDLMQTEDSPIGGSADNKDLHAHPDSTTRPTATTFFINEENCYRPLALGLTRFVKITTSPRNPNRHIPTDAELQHQARWISFECDDPWNQTPADNPDWLREFRREMGILEESPGQEPAQS